jgi:hypothetical protein
MIDTPYEPGDNKTHLARDSPGEAVKHFGLKG